ncbi:MAG: RagB/SusD family nutrient uptake outer membrane protein [Paludibacter sp.]
MKNKNIKSIFAILSLACAISLTSCVNDLNVQPIDPSVIQTFDQDGVFAKIYSSLALTGQQGPAGNGDVAGIDEGTSAFIRLLWNLNELTTDEAICSWGDPGIPEMNFNKWTSSHDQVKGLYYRLYFDITLCNQFLTETSALTDEKSLKQRAEARFMRALNYYYLLDMFGNVPFTETVTLVTSPPQIKRADLFAYVNKELAACEGDMYQPKEAGKPYYRVDQAANWLLRSRLFLNSEVYTGVARYDSAAIYAKKVIDSGYTLCPVFRQLFMADNAGNLDGSSVNMAPNEIIFPIAQDGTKTTSWGGSLFLIASTRTNGMLSWGCDQGWGGNRARSTLVKKFFPTGTTFFSNEADLTTAYLASMKDSRALFDKKSVSLGLNISNPGLYKQGYQVIKYTNVRADGAASNNQTYTDTDVPFMRAAEAYLNYAEAVLRGGAVVGGYQAIDAVNALRTRAGAPLFNTTTNILTLQKIIDERAREFFFEGYRRSDLIRFGQYGGANVTYTWDWKAGLAPDPTTGTPQPATFSADMNIFPIPSTDINANANLTQNPGY